MKLKLSPKLIRLAYRFFDVEASAETAVADGRIIEYAFAIQRLSQLPKGKVLDVGCTARLNHIPATMAALGWEVWGLDLREFKFRHPNFHFVSEDIINTSFEDGFFDAICAVSTLEHIGLSGRYGVTKEDLEGDAKAVKEIARILRPDGTFLVTVPYGQRVIIRPLHKVYDKAWLRELFLNWRIKDEIYHVCNENGYWEAVPEKVAALVNNKTSEDAIALLELLPLK